MQPEVCLAFVHVWPFHQCSTAVWRGTSLRALASSIHCINSKSGTVDEVEFLARHRDAALEALAPLGTFGDGIWGGDAIYLWARLPSGARLSGHPMMQ